MLCSWDCVNLMYFIRCKPYFRKEEFSSKENYSHTSPCCLRNTNLSKLCQRNKLLHYLYHLQLGFPHIIIRTVLKRWMILIPLNKQPFQSQNILIYCISILLKLIHSFFSQLILNVSRLPNCCQHILFDRPYFLNTVTFRDMGTCLTSDLSHTKLCSSKN